MKSRPTFAVFAMISLLSILSSLAASLPFININPSTQVVTNSPGAGQYLGFDETHANNMIGYTFYLQEAITVTQVGWYDEGQDGLSRNFQVGLWQDLSGMLNWPYISPQNSVQLLGDPVLGITIPAGNSASLNGVWRIVGLPSPLTLQPGGYELAGLDTTNTPDVIKYVLGGPSNPQVTIGAPVMNYEADPLGFHASGSFIALNGLELGPMLFLNSPPPLIIIPSGANIILTWPTNASGFTLQSAPDIAGTFTNIPGATSPYTNPISGTQKFYRLSQ
jgi:hypothetical protein